MLPNTDLTRDALTTAAHDRFGAIDPTRIATHILGITAGTDPPIQRAAFEALLRRYRFATRDELRVVDHPRGDLGDYRTARPGATRKSQRPYITRVCALDPIETSCACPDFLRSSLGVCKHGLAVAPEVSTATVPTAAMSTAGLKIERLPDGGLRVDAPAALAEPLAGLLEQLAAPLRAGSDA